MKKRWGESGNIFFTLFGAVALVGVVGAATSTLMRGPVGTVVSLNQRAKADSQMQIAMKLAMLEAQQRDTGAGEPAPDCDGDFLVEPMHPGPALTGLTGGGQLPSVGSTTNDPWGIAYGYCGWDHGTLSGPASEIGSGCANGSAPSQPLLDGVPGAGGNVIAVISAGPDRQFGTTCVNAPVAPAPYITRNATTGRDDVVIEMTYAEANEASGGLWYLQSGSDNITTGKGLDVSQGAQFSGQDVKFDADTSFSGNVDLRKDISNPLAKGGLFMLPDETGLTNADCDATTAATNAGALRRKGAMGQVLQICDPLDSSPVDLFWSDIGGSGAIVAAAGNPGELQYNNAGVMGGAGTLRFNSSGGLTANGASNFTDIDTSGDLNVSGSTILDTTLSVAGNTTLTGTADINGATSIDNTLNVTGDATFDSEIYAGNGTSAVPAYSFTSDTDTGIYYSSGGLRFGIGGTDQLAIAAGGITANNASITTDLTVGNNLITNTLTVNDVINADRFLSDMSTTSALLPGFQTEPGTGMYSAVDNSLSFVAGGTPRVVIDGAGDVGIGVTNPEAMLDVGGEVKIGTSLAACGITLHGAIRYVSGDVLQVCSSVTNIWETIGTSGGGGGGASDYWKRISVADKRLYYTDNFVGVGTNDPLATFHVNGDFLNTGTFTGTASAPVSGAGTRMFFDVESGSFRAGTVLGAGWDSASLGQNSTAMGFATRATGNFSTAFGDSTIATGTNSTALGRYVGATGASSLAIGLSPAPFIPGVSPVVSGTDSLGIFMGSQSGTNLAAADTMALLGGRFLIDQTPAASPAVSGTLSLDVEGGVGAVQYCDEDGVNCFTAASIATGGVGAPGTDRDVIFNSGGVLGTDTRFRFSSVGNLELGGTGAIKLPAGTSATRPASPVNGMIRYNSTSGKFEGYQGGNWYDIITTGGGGIAIDNLSDAITDYTSGNMYLGQGNGDNSTTGSNNTALGNNALAVVTIGSGNTAVGNGSLASNISAAGNTAVGNLSMNNIISGQLNTAMGFRAMQNNQTGTQNVAIGYASLYTGTTGSYNVAVGPGTLNPTTGDFNVALGYSALASVTTGTNNVGLGTSAGGLLTDGSANIVIGSGVQLSNPSANYELNIGNTITGDMVTGNIAINGTGALTLPIGQNATRPATPVNGMLRYNSTSGKFEGFQGGTWQDILTSAVIGGAAAPDRGIQFNSGNNFAANSNFVYTSVGNVGIGTATPMGPLDVGNVFYTASTGTINIRPNDAGNAGARIQMLGAGINPVFAFDNSAGNPRIFSTGSATNQQVQLFNSGGIGQMGLYVQGNVGFGTVTPQAALDIAGTNAILLPRGQVSNRPVAPINGMLRYNSVSNKFEGYQGGAWLDLLTSGGGVIAINDLSDAITNYTSGNMYLGENAGVSGTTAYQNVALGKEALSSNLTGYNNTAIGYHALRETNADFNTGIGAGALLFNDTGTANTALGQGSLYYNTTGDENLALGSGALSNNLTGSNNVAVGTNALISTSAANANVGVGHSALAGNTTGQGNTALGHIAGSNMTAGDYNIMIGYGVAAANTTGSYQLNIGNTITGDMATGNIAINGTGALTLPVGQTATRPTSPVNGMLRYNSVSGKFEGYQGGAWQDILTSGVAGGAAAPDRGIQFNSGGNFAADSRFIYTSQGVLSVSGTYTATGSAPLSGAGTRMYFDPGKSVFRAGSVTGAQWNNTSTGIYSTATGLDTIASGQASTAMGQQTVASGNFSTATGILSIASGNNSVSMGNSVASGDYATAMGISNASGVNSVAMGVSIASGAGSVAMGTNALASGPVSLAIGQGTVASGYASMATGNLTTASGHASTALGNFATAYGSGTMAFGLVDHLTTVTVHPEVRGDQSLGIFMGDQESLQMTAANTMGLFGGKLVIDPRVPAQQLTARGVIDVGAATDAIVMPLGGTSQRPVSPVNGMLRYNSNSGKFEGYQGGAWQDILTSAVAGGAAAPDRGIQFNSGGSFAAASNFIYTSTGFVGIGTNAPVTNLSVLGRVGSYGQLALGDTGDAGMMTFRRASDGSPQGVIGYTSATSSDEFSITSNGGTGYLRFNTGGAERIRILTSGNIGIGTATPYDRLDIAGTTAPGYEGRIIMGDASNFSPYMKMYKWDGVTIGNFWQTTIGNSLTQEGAIEFQTGIAGSSTIGGDTQATRMIISRAGNVGIGTTTPQAKLDISGTDAILLPRGQVSNRPASPVNGMLRYNSVSNKFEGYQGGAWLDLLTSGGGVIAINDLSDAITNYTSGSMYLGQGNGDNITTGFNNTALGNQALDVVTSGTSNTAIGNLAMRDLTIGQFNVAIGNYAYYRGNGSHTTAIGDSALFSYTATGQGNTAIGRQAMLNATAGDHNTVIGASAGNTLLTGGANIIIGRGINVPNPAGNYQLNIGDIITGDMTAGLLAINGTGALTLPIGQTGTRPASPVNGMLRYNSVSGKFEGYQGGAWQDILTSAVAGGAAAPDRGIQFNSGGSFAADSKFIYSSQGVLSVSGTYSATNTAPLSGAGTRMYFDPAKSAFRAGTVSGAQWNYASTGNYSTALGYNTIASGNLSTAMGFAATASGDFSTAMSAGATASGLSSVAMGNLTTASGQASTAMGSNTIASGAWSMAMGNVTTSSGIASLAMGDNSIASGFASTAMGSYATARGSTSAAIGQSTTASGEYSTALGSSVTAGNGTAASGFGDGSMAIGLISNPLAMITTPSQVRGDQSYGIFMGDQDGLVMTANNTMGLFGGTMVIDPRVPAQQLTARGVIDVGAATDAIVMPLGGTAQRPASPVNGMLRYNSNTGKFEGYQGGAWQDILTSAVAGGAAAPDRGIQFNSGGSFAADAMFTYTSVGNIGVGTASPVSKLHVDNTINNGTGAYNNIFFDQKFFQSSGPNNNFNRGTYATLQLLGNQNYTNTNIVSEYNANSGTTGTVGLLKSLNVTGGSSNGGNITNLKLIDVSTNGTGGGVIGTVEGLHVGNLSAANTPTFMYGINMDANTTAAGTTKIGLNIGDISGASTQNYSIYTGTAASYFGGRVGVGTGASIPLAQLDVGGTDAILLPRGQVSNRPASPVNGMLRYNSVTNKFEGYQGGAWQDILTSAVAGGAAAPDRGIQFNSGGSFAADSRLIYSSQGVLSVAGTYTGTNTAPLSGAGTRMYFDPAKSAFRAGTVNGTQWDYTSTGNYSTAMGYNAKASGDYSTAIGRGATATGNSDVAIGYGTTASGGFSTALSENSTASGQYSTSIGNGSQSSGQDSIALGSYTMAAGLESTAIGFSTIASGTTSTAMGSYVTAGNGTAGSGFGDGSMALGLIDDSVTISTRSQVRGIQSYGIFMGDQDGLTMTANNTMGLFGGQLVIDPRVPASQLSARGVIDVGAATDAIVMPYGATSQRPVSAVNGMLRYNSNTNKFEGYQGGAWQDILTSAVAGGAAAPDRGIQFNSGGSFAAAANFTYSSVGSVGIGTASPVAMLDVYQAANTAALQVVQDAGGRIFRIDSNGMTYNTTATIGSNTSAGLAMTEIYNHASVPGRFGLLFKGVPGQTGDAYVYRNTSDTPLFRVTAAGGGYFAGNVGIGTQTAQAALDITGTDAILLPRGQVSNRPASPVNGMLRYNSVSGKFEGYQAGAWADILTGNVTTTFLALTDTPATYAGSEGMFVKVNSGATALEFTNQVISSVVGAATPNGIILDNLDDVVITTPATTQVLTYNGTNWVNTPASSLSPPAAPDRGIQYNSGGSFAANSNLVYTSMGYLGIGTSVPAYTLSVAGVIQGQAITNAGDVLRIGNDTKLVDINLPNIMGLHGIQDSTVGAVQLGSTGAIIAGYNGKAGIGTLTPQAALDIAGTDALLVPRGQTSNRPASPVDGMLRYNSVSGKFEGYQAGAWQDILTSGLAGGAASPDRGIQFNSGGSFAANANFSYSSQGVLSVAGTYSGTNTAPLSGSGTRLYFDPAKSAFRAGTVTGAQWNYASTGNYSTAFGQDTIASGANSTAMGVTSDATGANSTVIGTLSLASGQYSTAIGGGNTASAQHSLAMGSSSNSTGQYSTAIGRSVQSTGYASLAMGVVTNASGNYSTAMGVRVTAGNGIAGSGFGDGSLALGLIDDTITITTPSQVRGDMSYGIFMGDQDGLVMTANNTMGVFGGTMVIDPRVPAQQLAARGVIDVGAATDAIVMPLGSTGQRPASPVNGMLRYNSNTNKFEGYQGGSWQDILTSAVAGGAASPDRGIQFNSGGNFAADTNLVYSSVGAFMVSGTYTGLTSPPASGAGTRMYFDPGRSAFRVGTVTDGRWDYISTGNYSTATGRNTMASGNDSFASGAFSKAEGTASTALGWATYAGGSHSTALGDNSFASGTESTSIGVSTISNGLRSMALGTSTTASGHYSTSLGKNVVAGNGVGGSGFGDGSMAVGLIDELTGITTPSQVRGDMSMGIFMGDQDGLTMTANSTMGLFGGTMVIDPRVPAQQLAARGILDLGAGTDALLLPLGSTGQRPGSAVNGMIRYNSTTNKFEGYQNSTWVDIIATAGAVSIDDLTDATTRYASASMYFGSSVGNLATGINNTALGSGTMQAAASGSYNSAFGTNALSNDTTGSQNTAIGNGALNANVIGTSNTALGMAALATSVASSDMVAIGVWSQRYANDSASTVTTGNTSVGNFSQRGSTTPANNIGSWNTSVGYATLFNNTSGTGNSVLGFNALNANTSGGYNTALGYYAGANITTGSNNITIGNSVNAASATGSNQLNIGNVLTGDMATGTLAINGTGALTLPIGQTGNRPSGVNGMLRYNSVSNKFEGYQAGTWQDILTGAATSTFLSLTDTPASYAGEGGKYLRVNAGATAVEFTNEIVASVSGEPAPADIILDDLGDVIITTPSASQVLSYNGTNWVNTAASSGTPGAPDRGIQYNSGGTFAANSNFVYSSQGVFSIAGTYSGTNTAPVSGAGTRMYFDPAKSAFRAGTVSGSEWSYSSTGNYSAALNRNTTAIGDSSLATGANTVASGAGSTAMGASTVASGDQSIAMGGLTLSSGIASTAMGWQTTASGYSSTAMGIGTVASGSHALASGYVTTASGQVSMALGNKVIAGNGTAASGFGDGSMALGLIDNTITITTPSQVRGDQALGIFMGDQDGLVMTANNTMGLFGGTMVIDPRVPAQQLAARSVLDLGAATDSIVLPSGTTAQRPGTLVNGMLRYNSQTSKFEGYQGGSWQDIITGAATSSFISLTDTPASYAGEGGKYLRVNAGATAVEFTDEIVPTVSGGAAPADTILDDLGDVVITTPSASQVLSYNGTNWVNTAASSGTPGSPDRGIQFNSGGTFAANANFVFSSVGYLGVNNSAPDTNLEVTGGLCVSDATGDNCASNPGQIRADGSIIANAFDLAERYPADTDLESGTIVALDSDKSLYVREAQPDADAVVGIVSTDPGLVLGWEDNKTFDSAPHVAMIALSGRVPLKVTGEGGAIKIGDRIALSTTTAGHGTKATQATGTIVGIALEAFDAADNMATGKITVFVQTRDTIIEKELRTKISSLEQKNVKIESAMNDIASDIEGLKAHTGYGINKAGFGPGLLAGMALMFGFAAMFFVVVQRKKRT